MSQDEATVRELAEDDRTRDVSGLVQRTRAWLFGGDMFACVAADPALLRIHSTAEEYERAAEECFNPFQVTPTPLLLCVVLSFHSFCSQPACLLIGSGLDASTLPCSGRI